MQLVIVGTYPNKEDTELYRSVFYTRPGEPLLVTTDKGTSVVQQGSDDSIDVVLRLPCPAEPEVPVE